jgi:hypothetical protein
VKRPLLFAVCTAIGALSACEFTEPADRGTWRSVVDHDAWTPLAGGEDPLSAHRPPVVHCERPFAREGSAIEIDTGACNYVSLTQPLAEALERDQPLALRIWWARLNSTEPAEGHIAVLLDGELLWDEWVPIPGPSGVRSLELTSPIDAPAGTEVVFHLHNHGVNTWKLERFEALDEEPQ